MGYHKQMMTHMLKQMLELVCEKVRGNCLKTASQILLGQKLHAPSQEVAEQILELFGVSDQGEDVALAIAQLNFHIKQNPQLHTPLVTKKNVVTRMHRLRNAAQPGASGIRNSHIKACLLSDIGTQALVDWCHCWAKGQVTQLAAGEDASDHPPSHQRQRPEPPTRHPTYHSL